MAEEDRNRSGEGSGRRGFLAAASTAAMAAGLAGGYGAFAAIAGRFLYPARPEDRGWQFVIEEAQVAIGDSLHYRTPAGENVNITRKERNGVAGDFIALSSTCPHLGCQVHWEGQNNRYFCPCHNGVFDPNGVATAGPPGEAGQSLPRYQLKIEKGLLYIEVGFGSLTASHEGELVEARDRSAAGHDPCLDPHGGKRSA
jgi:Rieske Fe-S protein